MCPRPLQGGEGEGEGGYLWEVEIELDENAHGDCADEKRTLRGNCGRTFVPANYWEQSSGVSIRWAHISSTSVVSSIGLLLNLTEDST